MPSRRALSLAAKLALTLTAFVLLMQHRIVLDGKSTTVLTAVRERAGSVAWDAAWPWLLAACGIKAVGIGCAIVRWQLLLRGQKLHFPWRRTAATFLIGRFVGTFLPGTLGLDGYKLFDASRAGGTVVAAAAATAVEKLLGVCGILLTFALSAPWGASILGERAASLLSWTWPVAAAVPLVCLGILHVAPWRDDASAPRWVQTLRRAAGSYRGQAIVLLPCAGLSFAVHATTATLYYFTARAIGVHAADFGQVVFASSIQIFVTVVSPLTVAGEGVREAVQALLLARHMGAAESVLSAALGFWAAEALTLAGGFLWWRRSS